MVLGIMDHCIICTEQICIMNVLFDQNQKHIGGFRREVFLLTKRYDARHGFHIYIYY